MRARNISSVILAVLLLFGMAVWAKAKAAPRRTAANIRAAYVQQNTSQPSKKPAGPTACTQLPPADANPSKAAAAPDDNLTTPDAMAEDKLCRMVKISVDTFGDDPVAKQLQAMIINALVATKKFLITDYPGNADAMLKGAALATTTGGSKSSGGQSGGRGGDAGGRGDVAGQAPGGADAGARGGGSSSIASAETVIDITVAVRLVASDGSVIWATTLESNNTTGMGPVENVAEAIVTQLQKDIAKLPPPAQPK